MSSVIQGSKTFKDYTPNIKVFWGWSKSAGWFVAATTSVFSTSGRIYSSEAAAKRAYKRCNTYNKAENLLYD